jgi:hypothetical protein
VLGLQHRDVRADRGQAELHPVRWGPVCGRDGAHILHALPAGSFALVKVDPNPPVGLEGTVKEVLNDGLYAHDGTKATFLIPSRIHAYKL